MLSENAETAETMRRREIEIINKKYRIRKYSLTCLPAEHSTLNTQHLSLSFNHSNNFQSYIDLICGIAIAKTEI